VTGEVKKKKKLGGAYPGQMGQQHAVYQPPASAFQNGQATAHFIQYGGGNALTLVQPNGDTRPQSGGPESQYVQVVLPANVESGQKIHVRAPDGRINEIIVPSGFGPGSVFTVEFAPASQAPTNPSYESNNSSMQSNKIPEAQAAAMNNTRPTSGNYSSAPQYGASNTNKTSGDDGFASGFNNPSWQPPPQQPTVYANTMSVEPEVDLSSYPTSQAVPVSNYSDPPKY